MFRKAKRSVSQSDPTLSASLKRALLDDGKPREMIEQAEQGRPDAQYDVAVSLGDLGPPAAAETDRWFSLAAKSGFTDDSVVVEGCGLDINIQKTMGRKFGSAIKDTIERAHGGSVRDQYRLGTALNYVDPPALEQAREWFTKAAEAGNVDSQCDLGTLLVQSFDPPEIAEGRRWWTMAAEAGDAVAQRNLGILLSSHVDPPEMAEARKWFSRAAEAGDAPARTWLETDEQK
jgi:TPR repeat protein